MLLLIEQKAREHNESYINDLLDCTDIPKDVIKYCIVPLVPFEHNLELSIQKDEEEDQIKIWKKIINRYPDIEKILCDISTSSIPIEIKFGSEKILLLIISYNYSYVLTIQKLKEYGASWVLENIKRNHQENILKRRKNFLEYNIYGFYKDLEDYMVHHLNSDEDLDLDIYRNWKFYDDDDREEEDKEELEF